MSVNVVLAAVFLFIVLISYFWYFAANLFGAIDGEHVLQPRNALRARARHASAPDAESITGTSDEAFCCAARAHRALQVRGTVHQNAVDCRAESLLLVMTN